MPSPDSDSGCYVRHGGEIEQWSQAPCGGKKAGVQACCERGDFCLEDSICHFTHPSSNTSGYYTGGCTDPHFNDPACLRQCSEHGTQDVVYNSQTGLWACCYGSGYQDCSVPSDETFQAPAPDDLTTVISSTTSASMTTSNTPTQSPTASSTTASASHTSPTSAANSTSTSCAASGDCSTGLGTKASIGVGSAVGGLLITGLLLVIVRRLRRPILENPPEKRVEVAAPAASPSMTFPQELNAQQQMELDSRTWSEMEGQGGKRPHIMEL